MRTALWSGVSLLGVLLCAAGTMFFLLSEYADWLAEHDLLMNILVALFLMTAGWKREGLGPSSMC